MSLPTGAEASSFYSLGVDPIVAKHLERNGFVTPTPIQDASIPAGLDGRDLIGVAQTGTGKTLAFALPIIQKLRARPGQALILVPTRELALQVEEAFRMVCSHVTPRMATVVLIGGTSVQNDRNHFSNSLRIIVATPGRLIDHLKRRNLSLNHINTVVLDEADRMFDMGFAPQIRKIMESLPKARQTKLFSATMPPAIEALAAKYLKDPIRVEVAPSGTSVKEIHQELCWVMPGEKGAVLEKILGECDGLTIIFSRTKHGANALNRKITALGYSCVEIHSNRSLSQRKRALEGFKKGRYQILVATDIAARGIDVEDVKLVINYDLPSVAEDYIHRIGRTGRAGKSGKAISLATLDQMHDVRQIEKLMNVQIPLSVHSIELAVSKPAFGRGGRRGGGSRSRSIPRSGRWR